MNPDLDIDAGAVRDCATGVAATAARVHDGAGRMPEVVPVPQWTTGDAAVIAAEAARAGLVRVGDEIAETARQIVAAVVDYDDADERAADRLRGVR